MYVFWITIIIILGVLILKINIKQIKKKIKILKFATSLPGASILSLFVNSLQIACNYKELIYCIEATTKKYGNLTRFLLGPQMFVVLAKPEDYKLLLSKENGNYKDSVTKLWDTFLGNGIIRTSGAAHKLRRKIINPLLNLKHLSEYVIFFDIYSNLCADTLEKNVDSSIFDLKPYIARYSCNIFLVTAMGIKGTAHEGENDDLLYYQEKLLKETQNRMAKLWLQLEWIFSLTESKRQIYIAKEKVLDFIYNITSKNAAKQLALQNNNNIFSKTKAIFNNYSKRLEELYGDVTSKYCQVSDENFIDDIRSFFIAIQNTTTEVATFLILMLGIHTEVQEKLRKEILVTFSNDKVDMQRLLNMQYLHMVFKETLRLFPSSPFLSREIMGDIKLESCTLPDGCIVMIPIFAIHRNSAYWYKPLEFIPERFSSENSSSRPRYTYFPFGTGLRDCLGQRYAFLSTATLIVTLLRRFRFVTTTDINDVKITSDVILRIQEAKLSISRI